MAIITKKGNFSYFCLCKTKCQRLLCRWPEVFFHSGQTMFPSTSSIFWPLLPFSIPDVLFGLPWKIKICVSSEHFLQFSSPQTENINKLSSAMGKLPAFCNLSFTPGVYYAFIHINFVVGKTYSQSLTSFQTGKQVRYHRPCY